MYAGLVDVPHRRAFRLCETRSICSDRERAITFPTHRVDRRSAEELEHLGSKPKFWFSDGRRRFLFKADDRGTGEDWAEVVSCHLCRLLGLPHVDYQLAAEYDGDVCLRPGVICENIAPPPKALVLANQLLLAVDQDYPSNQRYKVKHHTIGFIDAVLADLPPPATEWMPGKSQLTASDVFAGYLMLDVWIANQDRHHENWGAIVDTRTAERSLAPTFDHGAALARNLRDAEREERMNTKDKNRSISAFAAKARSAIFREKVDLKPLRLLDVFRQFSQRLPAASLLWLDRLRAVNPHDVSDILDQIPPHRMSATCREFTKRLLEVNRQRLLDWKISG